MSSSEEILDKRSMIVFVNRLIIWGGGFEDLLISDNKLLGFLYGLNVSLSKLDVMSKKCLLLRLVSMSMAKSITLNIFYNFFAYPIHLLTIYISQYEQSVIPI